MKALVTNWDKAGDRLRIALDNLNRAERRMVEGDYPDAIFRLQLSVEEACKAVLEVLGVEVEKTHFPSVRIGMILHEKPMVKELKLDAHQLKLLRSIVTHASVLESQGTVPRYGWETEDRIVAPEEVYVREVAEELFSDGLKALQDTVRFFETLKPTGRLGEAVQLLKERLSHG